MISFKKLLPARTIELGDVIGLVSVYICVCIVFLKNSDLTYLKL